MPGDQVGSHRACLVQQAHVVGQAGSVEALEAVVPALLLAQEVSGAPASWMTYFRPCESLPRCHLFPAHCQG